MVNAYGCGGFIVCILTTHIVIPTLYLVIAQCVQYVRLVYRQRTNQYTYYTKPTTSSLKIIIILTLAVEPSSNLHAPLRQTTMNAKKTI